MSNEPRSSASPDISEQLSALCDGELAADQSRFLIRRLGDNAELKQAWSRYHLIGDALRGHSAPPLPLDFASRVQSALEAESTAPAGHGWLRWAGGGAVAASVALLALLVVPQPAREPALQPASLVAEVVTSPLREADLRPDLSRAAQAVAGQAGLEPSPAAGSVPIRYIPVLQPDGSLLLVPYSPLQPLPPPSHPLAPPLKPVGQH
ncbi:MAG: sigma-E factor negative regulatory protein [Aquimonas sp.]|nr:sigma-E factor negative regulatory protein [Aquimonas sp.]